MAITVTMKPEQSASIAIIWHGLNEEALSAHSEVCSYFTEAWKEPESSKVHTGI